MTILPAKEAHKKWRDHVLKHYLDFVPAEKENLQRSSAGDEHLHLFERDGV